MGGTPQSDGRARHCCRNGGGVREPPTATDIPNLCGLCHVNEFDKGFLIGVGNVRVGPAVAPGGEVGDPPKRRACLALL